MARPSKQLDLQLLASGRALFPERGCAGLTVRAVTEHAGIQNSLFHYHFGSKEKFLDAVLQQFYEDMFVRLEPPTQFEGPTGDHLRAVFYSLALFVKAHRQFIARVWIDVLGKEPAAMRFYATNAPRHLLLLSGLIGQAQFDQGNADIAPAQMLTFMLGSVVMPIVFSPALLEVVKHPAINVAQLQEQFMSDAAIKQRIDLALSAIAGKSPKKRRKQ